MTTREVPMLQFVDETQVVSALGGFEIEEIH